MKSLLATLNRIFSLFKKAPFLILLVQIPEVSVDWVDRVFRATFEAKPLLAAATLFPYFILTTALSTALTALAARKISEGQPVKAGWLLSCLWQRLGLFIKTSILCGIFVMVGMPVLLPAVYFMTVYIFVPVVTVFDPPSPALAVLSRSKRLAKLDLKKVLAFTLLSLGIGVAFFLVQGELEKWLTVKMQLPSLSSAVADSIFALALGVLVNLGIFVIYEELVQKRNAKKQEMTQNIISTPNT